MKPAGNLKIDPDELLLWIDDSLLVINKPPGLPTLPDGYDPHAPHIKSALERLYGPLWIVHRLDRDTGGVLALARNPVAHRNLSLQFENRTIAKIYHALVSGSPSWEERRVSLPLRPDADRQHRTLVDARQGKPAVTNLRVLERFGSYTLVEARPETGRAHQIRVHLASLGLAVVADALYGSGVGVYLSHIKPRYKPSRGEERPLLGRLGLHARSLHIRHPDTDQPLILEAPHPKDFETTLRNLRKFRR
jgi:RluA family pseudouridine synthase